MPSGLIDDSKHNCSGTSSASKKARSGFGSAAIGIDGFDCFLLLEPAPMDYRKLVMTIQRLGKVTVSHRSVYNGKQHD